jgi:serine-type D-Ala-D-Ala carboxypeptidase (penicillin-binding protein 5/6)
MKQLLVATCVFAILAGVFTTPQADSAPTVVVEKTPELVVTETPVSVSAKAYAVIDIETGEVLFAQNADEVLPIASITKLFTAAALPPTAYDAEIVVTAADIATEGRAGKLEAGEVYSAYTLLFPLLLESSNDAAVALERITAVPTVASMAIADTSGLSSGNRASARVLVTQIRSLYQTHPHIFDITKLKQFIGPYTGWVNNSPVAASPEYRGGKHGYTEAAGRTLAAVFAEPTIHDRELGYVILGSSDIQADTFALRAAVKHSVHLQ